MDTFSTMKSFRNAWIAVIAVSLATFSVVTTEMLPVGLLTPIAGTLNITTGSAGLMISLPALLAALFAPLVVIASGGIDRRWILCGLLALLRHQYWAYLWERLLAISSVGAGHLELSELIEV